MVMQATKLTPEVFLSAPRRSAGIPNPEGSLILFTVSIYSFEEHKKTVQVKVLDIASGETSLLYDDVKYSDFAWINNHEFVFVKPGEKGRTSLMLGSAFRSKSEPVEIESFNGSIENVKVVEISKGKFAFACTALADPKGELYNPEEAPKPHSTAKVYDKLFVRHWDAWVEESKNAIFYGTLERSEDDVAKLTLQSPGLTNLLADTKLQSPVPPFGGAGDFDLSSEGIVFVASDPKKNAAMYTKSDLYYMNLSVSVSEKLPVPQMVKTGNLQGYSASPVFSHDGKSVVFTRMKHIQYESDKPRLLLIPDVKDLANVQEFFETPDGVGGWDRSPESIIWSSDAKEIYVSAGDNGRSKLFKFPSSPVEAKAPPELIHTEGSIGGLSLLGNKQLFLSQSSFIDSSFYTVLDPSDASSTRKVLSSMTKQGRSFSISSAQIDEFWCDGAGGDYKVHAWVVKPSKFDSSKKYPLAFLIHGGPQGAWQNAWSTRWNPMVFAEQGYVVVMPNPTGSTTYGMALQDGIAADWGGKPYNDIVNCFEHVAETMLYVDMDRAVAAGASYGGYMINWIQGHPLGRKFKALVCHDGIFSTLNNISTEELFFPWKDFGGTFWDKRETYEKWDPARFVDQWATPMLVIHNELDYRIPISEGLAMFNVLQARGIPSRFLMFPDENHWVIKPENSLVWHQEVFAWMNKYSGISDSNASDEDASI